MVKKEWMCAAHGAFESAEESPECPRGCDTVSRAFLTPPGFRSARTSNIDATLETAAKRHGLTDMQNRHGQAVKRESPIQRQRQEQFQQMVRERYGSTGWGAVPPGATMNTQTREVSSVEGRSGPGAVSALAQYHGHPDNALDEAKPGFIPKPVIIKSDHENLQVDVKYAP